ncbi:hypothetical protein NHG23_05505 [Aerococcaceae bacterium NML190073]|nr:hypothetical protein [Aerococcaceae bacterium NML190073]
MRKVMNLVLTVVSILTLCLSCSMVSAQSMLDRPGVLDVTLRFGKLDGLEVPDQDVNIIQPEYIRMFRVDDVDVMCSDFTEVPIAIDESAAPMIEFTSPVAIATVKQKVLYPDNVVETIYFDDSGYYGYISFKEVKRHRDGQLVVTYEGSVIKKGPGVD